MMISDMNWMDVERQVARDTRCVLPIGSVEQHAQLSLCVDVINSERVAREAAEPLGVPVYPVIPYGMTPYFTAYPGTVTLRIETLMALMRDIIASLRRTGFNRILIVNGHGGNSAVGALGQELMADYGDISIRLHNWWNAPLTAAKTREIHPIGTHANWMENFPWTRLAHAPAPEGEKPAPDMAAIRAATPQKAREILGDGNFGGPWQVDDEAALELWKTGVEETRAAIEGPWPELERS
ncbi:creatininase family protein [Denitrobaculum tricleocarpae]|uniref:Creatininase family protein n=1 Tax=Denitrobaculum tricleocarpae TaxID=2591009 RepID=A0A545TAY6_9PROT|nr:creatininase family protein [Denitrobaculum tricleocarpae]TQV74378.1 creatininase family protein [Denitrobaculum tricleocarpae]